MVVGFLISILSLQMNAEAFVCNLLKNADDWDAAARLLSAVYSPRTQNQFNSRLPTLLSNNSTFRASYLKARTGALSQVEAIRGEELGNRWIFQVWIEPFADINLRSREGPNPAALLLAIIPETLGGSLEPITNKIVAAATRFLNEETGILGVKPLLLTKEYEVSSQAGYLPVLLPGGEYAYFDVVTFSIHLGQAPEGSLRLIDRLWEASVPGAE